jgi:hypothetical protein
LFYKNSLAFLLTKERGLIPKRNGTWGLGYATCLGISKPEHLNSDQSFLFSCATAQTPHQWALRGTPAIYKFCPCCRLPSHLFVLCALAEVVLLPEAMAGPTPLRLDMAATAASKFCLWMCLKAFLVSCMTTRGVFIWTRSFRRGRNTPRYRNKKKKMGEIKIRNGDGRLRWQHSRVRIQTSLKKS